MLDNGETAESPLLTSIEVLKVQAQSTTTKSGDNQVDGSTEFTDLESNIDAGDMNGTVEFWSEDSRANLVIEGIENESASTTIGMRSTDAGVDYAAFFYNINNTGTTEDGATLTLDLVNVQALTDGNDALTDNQYKGFKFTLDGVEYIVQSEAFAAATTYEDLAIAINAQFVELGLSTLTATLGDDSNVYNSDTSAFVGTKTAIVITNSADGVLDYNNTDAWITDPNAPATDNVAAKMTNEGPTKTSSLTQTDIILDDAGHGSKGGSLLAGNMSDGTTHDGSNGIQQFNVEVDRDSWIEGLYTTANDLEKIVLENISTNNTDGNGSVVIEDIQDVQTLDATAMKGSVNVTANLSSEVAAKYMNLTDTAANAASDNIGFNYSLGTNNDTLNLTISNANLAAAGSTSREDFDLVINGNGGNDTITTIIGDGSGTAALNWFKNHEDNANLAINAGDGDDTITTTGAGNWNIDAGDGKDTVYADNSGTKAAWVVAATGPNPDINNLDGAGMTTQFLVDGKLTVSLLSPDSATDNADAIAANYTAGYEVTVDIPTGDNYTVTQLHINQAIKKAINKDDVLSKLLVATDGPSDTLIITSLIDGLMNKDDLEIEVTAPDLDVDYTAAQQTAILEKYKAYTGESDVTLAGIASAAGTANATTASEVTAIGAIQAVSGIGAGAAVLAESGPVTTVTYAGGVAANDGSTSITVNGVEFTSTFNEGDSLATIATAMNNVLNDAGIASTVAAGVISIDESYGVVSNASETDGTVTIALGSVGALAPITGSDSGAESDNIITGGADNDVIVLGTGTESNDTVVFSGSFGTDTVVNFMDDTAAVGNEADQLDFTAYLTTQVSTSTSADSATNGAVTAALLPADIIGNSVLQTAFSVVSPLDGSATNTFDTLTDAQMLTALNADSTFAVDQTTNHYGTTSKAVIMVENDLNEGEYKVYDVTYTEPGAADDADNFTSAKLVGTIDFGESITVTTADLVDHA